MEEFRGAETDTLRLHARENSSRAKPCAEGQQDVPAEARRILFWLPIIGVAAGLFDWGIGVYALAAAKDWGHVTIGVFLCVVGVCGVCGSTHMFRARKWP